MQRLADVVAYFPQIHGGLGRAESRGTSWRAAGPGALRAELSGGRAAPGAAPVPLEVRPALQRARFISFPPAPAPNRFSTPERWAHSLASPASEPGVRETLKYPAPLVAAGSWVSCPGELLRTHSSSPTALCR